jgi:hypothetical protein
VVQVAERVAGDVAMFTDLSFVSVYVVFWEGDNRMATARTRSHKHFRWDPVKVKRAQTALGTDTETEAIDRALDFAFSEGKKNRLAAEANKRFVTSGIDIKDVYGALEE